MGLFDIFKKKPKDDKNKKYTDEIYEIYNMKRDEK
mgnify:CR=1 FL=1